MSKLEIAGPKELLVAVMEAIRDAGTFQPEGENSTAAGPESFLPAPEKSNPANPRGACALHGITSTFTRLPG